MSWPFAALFESAVHTRSLVTVAVSLYNYRPVILDALESVRAQDLPDLDLVVVDDRSTDGGGGEVLDWLSTHHARFGRCSLLQHQQNQGLARVRNLGFAQSLTPFVLVLDADNELFPRCASACLAVAQSSKADAVASLIEVFGEDRGIMGSDAWDPARLLRGNYVDAMALVRRDAWSQVGGYRRMVLPGWEDYDFWLKCAEQGLHVGHLTEILCRYRKSSTSMLSVSTREPASRDVLVEDIRRHHPSALRHVLETPASGRPHELRRLDSRALPSGAGEIRAFLLVRNECGRLPSSLAAHRKLGVDRFFVIDNGSRDGTIEYLLEQADVHIFQTHNSYQEARLGIDWLEQVLHDHGTDRWCVLLDADERLVYPDCESIGLSEYCNALEQQGLDCLMTMFLDLYSDKPIAETRLDDTRGPLDDCPFFDPTGYYRVPSEASRLPRWYGGPRARLFFPEVASSFYEFVGRAFDEEAYLAMHADVSEAVNGGRFVSGLDHFRLHGRSEERALVLRQVDDWPERTYLAANPDVRDAIAAGTFRDGLEHFVRYGQFEPARAGRGSAPPCLSQVPLVRWRQGISLDIGRHQATGVRWRRRDAVGGVLLHFRLMADLVSRAAAAADGARDTAERAWATENERYRYVLGLHPGLSALTPSSARYRDSRQLLQLGLITPVDQL
jgi:glycosyltransferase involved in cell wall biosynthesis